MANTGHLWAIGYDDMEQAEQLRHELIKLGNKHYFTLLDSAVAVRYRDGSFTLDGQPFVAALDFGGHSFADFLAGLALGAPPLTGAAVRALKRSTVGVAAEVGIDDAFIKEVESLMKPGTSALFLLDEEGDLEAGLQGIRGIGGTVLKTNVDVKRARLIRSTLAATQTQTEDRP
jgi:uncharacterized membrane protein